MTRAAVAAAVVVFLVAVFAASCATAPLSDITRKLNTYTEETR